jgi:hypothetical protein
LGIFFIVSRILLTSLIVAVLFFVGQGQDMIEMNTIVLTVVGVGLVTAAINITTFLYLLGRLSTVEKEVAFIHGLLVRQFSGAVTDE